MMKKGLVLALLLPVMGGCFWSEERGYREDHREYRTVVVEPAHVHCVGCGHVYRGGVWVVAD